MTKYEIILYWSDEDGVFVADVPELPGCMSQGKTLDDAVENIRDAIRGYLQVLQQHGKPYAPTDGGTFVGEVAV